ncbi:hypothetical protein [Streptomyces curacoi]|uniref:hypothetical protein n=1 Tax=Streptomyces curacoi TaxID=146536 RepID=UPI000A4CBBE9|nr:hypothetical protein [Streptomyces curacoi]
MIELKTGCTGYTGCVAHAIAKKDVHQLGGSVRWLNKNNPEIKALPVMAHPSQVCPPKGPQPVMHVVTPLLGSLTKSSRATASSTPTPKLRGPTSDREISR